MKHIRSPAVSLLVFVSFFLGGCLGYISEYDKNSDMEVFTALHVVENRAKEESANIVLAFTHKNLFLSSFGSNWYGDSAGEFNKDKKCGGESSVQNKSGVFSLTAGHLGFCLVHGLGHLFNAYHTDELSFMNFDKMYAVPAGERFDETNKKRIQTFLDQKFGIGPKQVYVTVLIDSALQGEELKEAEIKIMNALVYAFKMYNKNFGLIIRVKSIQRITF